MFSKSLHLLVLLITLMNDSSSSTNDIDVSSAKIVFYYGPTSEDYQSYDLENAASILAHPKFRHNQTNCFMHGYMVSQEAFSTQLVVKSYLKRNSINLLSIDWKILAAGSYVSAQQNLLCLGPKVADAILDMIDAGLDGDTLSLVGHSLGGLGVGIISREVYKKSHGRVVLPRITALDPSNAAAHEIFILPPIQKTDARFVDVIHTDAGGRGTAKHMGHADFWPNGGVAIQLGCPSLEVNDKCSHRKSWAYWAQSVAEEEGFQLTAYQEDSYEEFLENWPHQSGIISGSMGINCPMSANGSYYLRIESSYGAVPDVGLLQ